MEISQGDVFRKPYPFCSWSNTYENSGAIFGDAGRSFVTEEGWKGGCERETQDGPAVYEGQCHQEEFYECDAEGFIEYEVLAVAAMPRKYQDRIIYRVTMIEPEGNERKSSAAHMVTRAKFEGWVTSGHSSYPYDYEVRNEYD